MNANALFYSLLQSRKFDAGSREYAALREDEKLRRELEDLAHAFDCQIGWYPRAVYLIPNTENDFLGLSRSEMRGHFSSSESSDLLNLRYFIILVILLSFYGSSTSSRATRPFLQVSDLMNEVSSRLKEGMEREEDSGIVSYKRMYGAHASLSPQESRRQNSRYGFYRKIIRWLEDEGLITFYQDAGQIRTLPMLDDKIDFMLRDEKNAALFQALKGGSEGADIG